MANALTVSVDSTPLLEGYKQGLLLNPSFPGLVVFLRCIAGATPNGRTGFTIVWTKLHPFTFTTLVRTKLSTSICFDLMTQLSSCSLNMVGSL